MNPAPSSSPKAPATRLILALACVVIVAVYAFMIDLKGISTDEGLRMGVINGGDIYTPDGPSSHATWARVVERNSFTAYQPLYFLIQNTLMRLAGTQNVVFFRAVNIFFLWLSLQGLIALSTGWRLLPRLFALGVFGFNAYLFMHVLQVREYIVGVTFYIWSTWLVLRLDRRPLVRPWADTAWFAAYGVLLALGFFVQSWVVFPAVAQGMFLVWRKWGDRLRFYAHLALSYVVVLSATWPYLRTHQQKVDIGRWGTDPAPLMHQLSHGFHLVLGGHLAGQSPFADVLFWFWLVFIAATAALLLRRPVAPAGVDRREYLRQGGLMLTCIAIALAFQVTYFLKVDTLAVWPRYFVVHYFFCSWLIALGFKSLDDLRVSPASSHRTRGIMRAVVGAMVALALFTGIFQARSYYKFPLVDTGVSEQSNWRTLSAELARNLQPGDVVVIHDIIQRWTITFTHPVANPVLVLSELGPAPLVSARRVLYLEPMQYVSERDTLAAQMNSLGFGAMENLGLHTTDGKSFVTDWRLLVFTRR